MVVRLSSILLLALSLLLLLSIAVHVTAKSETEQGQVLQQTEAETTSTKGVEGEESSAESGDAAPNGNMVVKSSRGSPNVLISSKNTIRDIKYKKRIVVDYTMGRAMKRIREEAKKVQARELQRHLDEDATKTFEQQKKQDERDMLARRWQKRFDKDAKKQQKEIVEDAVEAAKQTIQTQKEQWNKYKDEKAHAKKLEYQTKVVIAEEKQKLEQSAELARKKLEEENNKNIIRAKQIAAEAKEKSMQKVEAANKQEAGRKKALKERKEQESAQKKQLTAQEQNTKKDRETTEQRTKEQFQKQNK